MKNLSLQKCHIYDLKYGDMFKFHRKQKSWCIYIANVENKTKTNKKQQRILVFLEHNKIEITPFILSSSFCYKV
jgi:hypothetical protein